MLKPIVQLCTMGQNKLKKIKIFSNLCNMSIQKFEESNMTVMGKEIREMSSMTETNSVNIMSLVGLIKSQNKSLQNLQRQVSILKDRIPEESDSDTDVEESKREIFCDLCDEKHLAVYHCNDCSENLCETGSSFHKKGKATKGHIVKPLGEMTLQYSNSEEEATAVLMDLVEEHKITASVCAGPNEEIISLISGEIHIYNRKGALLRKFGKSQVQPGQYPDYSKDLINPSGLAVSKQGDILVVDTWQDPRGGIGQYQAKVYGIHGQFNHSIDMSQGQKLTKKGNIVSIFGQIERPSGLWKTKCYDEEGKEFPNPAYCDLAPNGDVYASHSSKFIYVFNSSGKYLRKFNNFGEKRHQDYSNISGIFICENDLYVVLDSKLICVLNLEGKFLYRFRVDRRDQNLSIQNISVFPSGELCVSTSTSVKIFRKGREYVQKSVNRKFNLVPKYQSDREMKEMEVKGVTSVTFPLCITVFPQMSNVDRPGMFTHTLYFDGLTSVKNAIFTVEEYFRQKVSKGDFQHLSLLLSMDVESYMKYLNVYNYNWAKCKKEKLVRGYFLGGNVLSSLEIKGETELVLDITQD